MLKSILLTNDRVGEGGRGEVGLQDKGGEGNEAADLLCQHGRVVMAALWWQGGCMIITCHLMAHVAHKMA